MTRVFFESGAEVAVGRFDKGPICLGADLVLGPICLITVLLGGHFKFDFCNYSLVFFRHKSIGLQ